MSNREILIKLAEGKKFKLPTWHNAFIYMDDMGTLRNSNEDPIYFTDNPDWQEVVDPMRWEFDDIIPTRLVIQGVPRTMVEVPQEYTNKRIKIRVEEIV
jgi:hypothetical protein